MYSETLLELFHNPSCRRPLTECHSQTRQENPVCGDILELQARFQDGRIQEMGFGGRGCPPVIAGAEWICRWAPGKNSDQLRNLGEEELNSALGGLPKNKRHALGLCLEALEEICREMPQGV